MLYSHIHIHNININGNIVNNNDDFKERTNTLLYKNISHALFLKGLMLVVCVRWVGDGDRLLHIDPSSSDHFSPSFSSWLGLLNCRSLRAQSPLSATGSQFSILSPTDSNCLGHLVIYLSHAHLLPLFFCLFTQVYLLIDGSVEGQYVTDMLLKSISKSINNFHYSFAYSRKNFRKRIGLLIIDCF